MKRLILILTILLLLPAFVSAHPGRTASDGCHYCRTNCDKWGVPWGKRHCHSRESEPLPISKIKTESKERAEKTTPDIKTPGWEYGKEIFIDVPLIEKKQPEGRNQYDIN